MTFDVQETNTLLAGKDALGVLQWCYENFEHHRIILSTSFGAEGMVLLHMLANLIGKPRVFTIDTGRNFQETYDVWDEVIKQYGISIETFFPDQDDIRKLLKAHGPNMFYASVENRKKCCYIRKVKPLKKALANVDVWITGLRREQSPGRGDIQSFYFNNEHSVYKVCPLVNWHEQNIWEFIRNNDVPFNKLYNEGFPTIGCAPCCRSIGRAEDIRSGRWWWEKDEHKECGIHVEHAKTKDDSELLSFNI